MEATPGPNPIAIDLMLCDQVIIDKDTSKPCLIGVFTGLGVRDFADSQRLSVFAALTNGRGQQRIDLHVNRLDNDELIYQRSVGVLFPDPLTVANLNIRISHIVFPMAGWYEFILAVAGEPIARRRVRVYHRQSPD